MKCKDKCHYHLTVSCQITCSAKGVTLQSISKVGWDTQLHSSEAKGRSAVRSSEGQVDFVTKEISALTSTLIITLPVAMPGHAVPRLRIGQRLGVPQTYRLRRSSLWRPENAFLKQKDGEKWESVWVETLQWANEDESKDEAPKSSCMVQGRPPTGREAEGR